MDHIKKYWFLYLAGLLLVIGYFSGWFKSKSGNSTSGNDDASKRKSGTSPLSESELIILKGLSSSLSSIEATSLPESDKKNQLQSAVNSASSQMKDIKSNGNFSTNGCDDSCACWRWNSAIYNVSFCNTKCC